MQGILPVRDTLGEPGWLQSEISRARLVRASRSGPDLQNPPEQSELK